MHTCMHLILGVDLVDGALQAGVPFRALQAAYTTRCMRSTGRRVGPEKVGLDNEFQQAGWGGAGRACVEPLTLVSATTAPQIFF